MIATIKNQIEEIIKITFHNWEGKKKIKKSLALDQEALAIAIANLIQKTSVLTIEYGLCEEDFLTPAWYAINESKTRAKSAQFSDFNGFIFSCVRNKILDTCRKATSVRQQALNDALKNKKYFSHRDDEWANNTFDQVVSEIALDQDEDNNDERNLMLGCLEAEYEKIKSPRYQQVILAWMGGASKSEIAKKRNLTLRQIHRVIKGYIENVKKRMNQIQNDLN